MEEESSTKVMSDNSSSSSSSSSPSPPSVTATSTTLVAPNVATQEELQINTKSELKFRDQLYRMIISQLFYDGYQHVAVNLSATLQANPPCPPSNQLYNLIRVSLDKESSKEQILTPNGTASTKPSDDSNLLAKASYNSMSVFDPETSSGLDFDNESERSPTSPDTAQYETCYVTSHKAPCRAAAFDRQGIVIATGSVDASIKILDIDRMLAKSSFFSSGESSKITSDIALADQQQQQTSAAQINAENHPVIRTLYDHADEITTLAFHPFEPILASGSRDYTVKFFEYTKPSTKKAFRTISEAEPIRCISFHPNGDWLLVATHHPTLRLYRVETSQCFVSNNPNDQHKLPVTSVEWSPNGRIFATGSKDGSVKIWDGISNRCVNTFVDAHTHQEVTSVMFSRNSKYLLTSGKDSVVRLWELSAARCLIAYTGAGTSGKQEKRTQATFNHNEDFVIYPDEKTTTLCCWDSRNAERQKLLPLGHNSFVKCIVHSPVAPQFITCSDDYRARFWCKA